MTEPEAATGVNYADDEADFDPTQEPLTLTLTLTQTLTLTLPHLTLTLTLTLPHLTLPLALTLALHYDTTQYEYVRAPPAVPAAPPPPPPAAPPPVPFDTRAFPDMAPTRRVAPGL